MLVGSRLYDDSYCSELLISALLHSSAFAKLIGPGAAGPGIAEPALAIPKNFISFQFLPLEHAQEIELNQFSVSVVFGPPVPPYSIISKGSFLYLNLIWSNCHEYLQEPI